MRVITRKDVPDYVALNFDNDRVIRGFEVQDKAVITDKKSGAFVVEKEVVEISSIPTQEYIDSFKDDVGIENVLKKLAMTNDVSLLMQRTRPTVPIDEDGKEVVQDYSDLPANEEEAIKIAAKAKAEFANLPQELVNNRSFMEFAETVSQEELNAYIATIKAGGNKDE